jgi:hypothetical protein
MSRSGSLAYAPSVMLCVLALAAWTPCMAASIPAETAEAGTEEKPSLPQALSDARKLALDDLKDRRFGDFRGRSAALSETFPGEPFLLFWPWESVLADFLMADWDTLAAPERWSNRFSTSLIGRTAPYQDQVGQGIWELFLFRRSDIAEGLERADLPPAQAGFLRLVFLDRWCGPGLADAPRRVEINRMAEAWLKRFPHLRTRNHTADIPAFRPGFRRRRSPGRRGFR